MPIPAMRGTNAQSSPMRALQTQKQSLQNQLLLMRSATDAPAGPHVQALEKQLKQVSSALSSARAHVNLWA